MKEIIIIAGPNGAGKTSFVNEFLPFDREGLKFVNADEIAREFADAGLSVNAVSTRAGREMIRRISGLIEADQEFIFETTLASLTYAQKIPQWKERGYSVHLVYLRLPSVEAALARVRRRVAAGGHTIPDDIVRTRFAKSLEYLDVLYKPIVSEWYLYDSLEGDFVLTEAWDD